MKQLLYTILITGLISCGPSVEQAEDQLERSKQRAYKHANRNLIMHQENIDKASVVTRDGCQYLMFNSQCGKFSTGYGMHKGDCTNQIHTN